MSYGETKVYFDGSHYIAIPHTVRPTKRRIKPIEEEITIIQDEETKESSMDENLEELSSSIKEYIDKNIEKSEKNVENNEKTIQKAFKVTHKELFEVLYKKYIDLKRNERKKKIIQEMKPYFKDKETCEAFVILNFQRKQRNLIVRRIRMCRKANLANFNYFCTFTYDNKLHTEESFKKKLKTCLRNLCFRKQWRYMGVWERAPETNRLHFHGLFYIPNNTIPGKLLKKRDYSFSGHKMQASIQSEYFNNRFGRSDFKEIDENERRLGNALAYLMKYIEKTGEKIVYSKGLPQYFISDIMDEDVVCKIGQEDKKLLLFDNFKCWDEGCLIGEVSPEVIEQMRKEN